MGARAVEPSRSPTPVPCVGEAAFERGDVFESFEFASVFLVDHREHEENPIGKRSVREPVQSSPEDLGGFLRPPLLTQNEPEVERDPIAVAARLRFEVDLLEQLASVAKSPNDDQVFREAFARELEHRSLDAGAVDGAIEQRAVVIDRSGALLPLPVIGGEPESSLIVGVVPSQPLAPALDLLCGVAQTRQRASDSRRVPDAGDARELVAAAVEDHEERQPA